MRNLVLAAASLTLMLLHAVPVLSQERVAPDRPREQPVVEETTGPGNSAASNQYGEDPASAAAMAGKDAAIEAARDAAAKAAGGSPGAVEGASAYAAALGAGEGGEDQTSGPEIVVLPETGGAPLLVPLAGVLLVAGGLLTGYGYQRCPTG